MEFLLINHPLDCPICDQGGECELQDISMGFGADSSSFLEPKRSVHDQDLGPLISTEMTRCIHCTRCVRFGQEIAGIRELGLTNRGEGAEISTYIKHSITSELSGNIIDLCPVGALTSKPFRFRARAWELIQSQSIAPHDCLGSNISIHCLNDKVMRVVPRENESINETWLSDRDRFSYLGLTHEDRIQKPMIKHQGQWQTVEWTKAFDYAAKGLKEIIRAHGAEQVAALMAPTATTEEAFLFQKLLRQLGINNIDHRLQQSSVTTPQCDFALKDIPEQDCILLIGSNVQREQPLLGAKVRGSTLLPNQAGTVGRVVAVNPIDFEFNFPMAAKSIVSPDAMVAELAAIAAELGDPKAKALKVKPSASAGQIAKELQTGERKAIILGALALNHPQAALIKQLAELIAKLVNAKIGCFTAGPNSTGAYLTGVVPQGQSGLNAADSFAAKLKAYLLFGVEPAYDCANPAVAVEALEQADFVIAFSAFKSFALDQHADIIFPIVPFSETDGTFINVEQTAQTFTAVTDPLNEARPGWKVLRVFGNILELEGFDYTSAAEVNTELQQHLQDSTKTTTAAPEIDLKTALDNATKPNTQPYTLWRIGEWPLYRSDALVRRSAALQQCAANEKLSVRMNQAMAQKFNLTDCEQVKVSQNSKAVELPLAIDSKIPDGCAYVANGYLETAVLGECFGGIEISVK